MNEATVFEAQTLVERFHDVHRRIEQTEAQIETVCRRFPTYRRIRTIPGFGPYVCSQVLAKIGDPHRFKARKQVIRLAGFDLNAKRSGKRSQTAVPVISKRGNADLRYALFQAALIASYQHAEIAGQVFTELPHLTGNVLHDAHTAILMREHGLRRICTRDTDFHRFTFLEVIDPFV